MKIFQVSIALIFTLFLSFEVCAASPIGRYVNSQDDSEFINLLENNKFNVFESKIHAEGTYVLENKELRLNFIFKGKEYPVKAILENGVIKDEDGKVWLKKTSSNSLYLILIAFISAVVTIILYKLSNKISNKFLQSAAQLGAIASGMVMLVLFSGEDANGRDLGRPYFYMLLGAIILNKVFSMVKSWHKT